VFHAQWAILLDEDFIHAYRHGIVVECLDGVMRRFYPRIFTYSADYPEK
jgi:Plavaka transposase